MELLENTIYIKKENETYIQVYASKSIQSTLSDFFSFFVPGHQFMPSFKMKLWDGKLRLYDQRTNRIYAGLLSYIQIFANERGYKIEWIDEPLDIESEFSLIEAQEFSKSLKLHAKHEGEYRPIEAHDYQIIAFRHAVQAKRCLLLSPTASGKSLIIYHLIRYYQEFIKNKILIVVPTTSLVAQLYNDFAEYSYADTWDVRDNVHLVYEGRDKSSKHPITISTWQSIYKLSPEYFEKFDMVIGDEAHGFKSDSLTKIMQKCKDAKYRFGTTGTLDGSKTHRLVLEGLFGKVYKVITTKELQEKGAISDMLIRCLQLHYPEDVKKGMKNSDYQKEIDFLVSHSGRNNFIKNLAISLRGNTLILFQLVEKHGKVLYDLIKQKAKEGRKVYFVHGKTETEDREEIRRIVENEKDAIIVASYGTFSTGINIRRLINVIFAAPSKSRIRILQSLGRGLRRSEFKDRLNLYDISDDLSYKSWKNYTLRHFLQRMELYNSEKFEWKVYKVDLNG